VNPTPLGKVKPMLALKRHIHPNPDNLSGRRIMIGKNIVITLVKAGKNEVIIGIEAPRDVAVFREELLTPEQVSAIERAACL
jgi:carbon storage regulator CsrA